MSQKMKQAIETGSRNESKVYHDTNGYYLKIPEIHLATSNIDIGDKTKIKACNYNGGLCLVFGDSISGGTKRKIRSGYNSNKPKVTIPKRIGEGATLEEKTIRYNSTQEHIIGILNHTSRITGNINVFDCQTETLNKWSNNSYPVLIPPTWDDELDIGDDVWFWFDTLGDGFVFVFETDESVTPANSIQLKVHTQNDEYSNRFVLFPKQVIECLDIAGEDVKWGRDDTRFLGFIEE